MYTSKNYLVGSLPDSKAVLGKRDGHHFHWAKRLAFAVHLAIAHPSFMPPVSQIDAQGSGAPLSSGAPKHWVNVLQFAFVSLMLVALYFSIGRNLAIQWFRDPNYSHGILAFLFSLWVVWKKKDQLAAIPANPNWSGILIIFAGLAILVLGVLGAENFLSRGSLLMVLAGLIVQFGGWSYLRALLFPLACLLLAIPIPAIVFNQISLPLQFQASKLAAVLLTVLGVPVLQEGNLIHLPSLTLDVAEACSGIRSLVSLVTLAVVYGYFFELGILRRWLLILSAIPIAVIANGLRVTGTGILGEYWSPETASGFFHAFSAFVIFFVSTIMLVLFHRVLTWLNRRFAVRHA
jgi:exosortase